MHKIIFLDIDGVLNSRKSTEKNLETAVSPKYIELPDKELIKNLNYIIENTGAKCILSSTWRYSYGYFALDTILYLLGAMPEILIGQTKGDRATRGREIEHWLKGKHIESFVVLDDETDIAPYMDNLVRVDSKVGLTKYDAERAIKILNGDINDT